MPTAKVSVAIDEEELAWARSVAHHERKSLSAVVTESLAERRRLSALRDVVDWMAKGRRPLSEAELAGASRELGADEPVPPRRKHKSPPRRRR